MNLFSDHKPLPRIVFKGPNSTGPDSRNLRILHTSDWHLGRSLEKMRSRHEELKAFLAWLVTVIDLEKIDVLLVCGDIFDSTAPSVQSQELYYNFLENVRKTACHSIVIISGNHDSAAFLSAPARLLRAFKIYVVAEGSDIESEVLTINDQEGRPVLVAAAVPFLKDRFLRLPAEGETIAEKNLNLIRGLKDHYKRAAEIASERQARLGGRLPVIALGHLFTAGGREGGGVRDLYAGNIVRIEAESFSPAFDYVALGHLHEAQKAGRETVRYCGTPIPMSFDESGRKSLTLVTLGRGETEISTLSIPVFQELIKVKGPRRAILQKIGALKKEDSRAWLEIIYTGQEVIGDLRPACDEAVKGSRLEVIKVYDQRDQGKMTLADDSRAVSLSDLTPYEVFDRLLEAKKVAPDEQADLKILFREIVHSLLEQGSVSADDL
ncbi:MAG: exonuclease SbcCD subunit D C-terminal domain-containing protein [Deltaproteobacteria bacterium]|jgi:exonuclease SbcD|nr:exonuclease SbcCD subunit D C-terminal domain-containing protein [Deltaproteobacteria bacterium]